MTERIEGESSISETISKEKLQTFTNNNKTTSVKMNGETLQIREERKLMNRIFVESRTRSEIDLPKMVGTYEFRLSPYQYLHQTDLCITPKANMLLPHN